MRTTAMKLVCLALLLGSPAFAKPPKNQFCCVPCYRQTAWCAQFPLMDDEGGTMSFYALDRYDDYQSPCLDGPHTEYGWYPIGLTTPELCTSGCQLNPPGRPNQPAKKIDKTYDIADFTPKANKHLPVYCQWEPKHGMSTMTTKWVRVKAADGKDIPIKIFVTVVDLKKATDSTSLHLTGVRTIVVGFEADGMPDEEKPHAVKPEKVDVDKDNKYKATITLKGAKQAITIVTNTALK